MNPCKLTAQGGSILDPGETLQACNWLDENHSLCSNLRCVALTPMAELAKIRFIYRYA